MKALSKTPASDLGKKLAQIDKLRKSGLRNVYKQIKKLEKSLEDWLQDYPTLCEEYARQARVYQYDNRELIHWIAERAWQRLRADKELLEIPRVELKRHQVGKKYVYSVDINGVTVATRASSREYFATLITREPGGLWVGSHNYFGRPDLLLSSSEVARHFRHGLEVVLACTDPTLLPGVREFDKGLLPGAKESHRTVSIK